MLDKLHVDLSSLGSGSDELSQEQHQGQGSKLINSQQQQSQ